MKKTLIALAVLAASGASFAQSTVTLSGAVGFGYTKDATSKGYEFTDGKFTLAAKEDLGGGLSAAASMTVDSVFGRQTASPTNGDTSLTLASTNGFTVTMASLESAADARKGDVSGISMEQGMDKSNYNLATVNVDTVAATYTLMPGLTIGASHSEITPLGDATATTKNTKFSAAYAQGPLSVFASSAKLSTTGAKVDLSLAASYDFGAAKVGAGYRGKGSNADSVNLVSVSVPMGAFNFGVVSAEYNGVRGTGYGVNYSLSKRTVVYASQGVSDAAALDKNTRIKLVHTF
jgi:hypothetical protein